MVTGLFEDGRFGPFSNLNTCILYWTSIDLESVWAGDSCPYQHCPKRQTTKSEIQVCRFEKGPNLVSSKSPLSIV